MSQAITFHIERRHSKMLWGLDIWIRVCERICCKGLDIWKIMCGSSHIKSVLIGVEYVNCCWTLEVYLQFAIWIGLIQSKLLIQLVSCN